METLEKVSAYIGVLFYRFRQGISHLPVDIPSFVIQNQVDGLFAFSDLAACFLYLFEGGVFPGTAQHQLIQKTIGFAGHMTEA